MDAKAKILIKNDSKENKMEHGNLLQNQKRSFKTSSRIAKQLQTSSSENITEINNSEEIMKCENIVEAEILMENDSKENKIKQGSLLENRKRSFKTSSRIAKQLQTSSSINNTETNNSQETMNCENTELEKRTPEKNMNEENKILTRSKRKKNQISNTQKRKTKMQCTTKYESFTVKQEENQNSLNHISNYVIKSLDNVFFPENAYDTQILPSSKCDRKNSGISNSSNEGLNSFSSEKLNNVSQLLNRSCAQENEINKSNKIILGGNPQIHAECEVLTHVQPKQTNIATLHSKENVDETINENIQAHMENKTSQIISSKDTGKEKDDSHKNATSLNEIIAITKCARKFMNPLLECDTNRDDKHSLENHAIHLHTLDCAPFSSSTDNENYIVQNRGETCQEEGQNTYEYKILQEANVHSEENKSTSVNLSGQEEYKFENSCATETTERGEYDNSIINCANSEMQNNTPQRNYLSLLQNTNICHIKTNVLETDMKESTTLKFENLDSKNDNQNSKKNSKIQSSDENVLKNTNNDLTLIMKQEIAQNFSTDKNETTSRHFNSVSYLVNTDTENHNECHMLKENDIQLKTFQMNMSTSDNDKKVNVISNTGTLDCDKKYQKHEKEMLKTEREKTDTEINSHISCTSESEPMNKTENLKQNKSKFQAHEQNSIQTIEKAFIEKSNELNIFNANNTQNPNLKMRKEKLSLFYMNALDYEKKYEMNKMEILDDGIDLKDDTPHPEINCSSNEIKCNKNVLCIPNVNSKHDFTYDSTNAHYHEQDTKENVSKINTDIKNFDLNDCKKPREIQIKTDLLKQQNLPTVNEDFQLDDINKQDLRYNVICMQLKSDQPKKSEEKVKNYLSENQSKNYVQPDCVTEHNTELYDNKKEQFTHSLDDGAIQCIGHNKCSENNELKNQHDAGEYHQKGQLQETEMFLITATDCFTNENALLQESTNFSSSSINEHMIQANTSIIEKDATSVFDDDIFDMEDDFILTESQLTMIDRDEKNQSNESNEMKKNSYQQTDFCSNTHFGLDSVTVEVIDQLNYIRKSVESIQELLNATIKKT